MKAIGLHKAESPSEWVVRWSHLVKPEGTVLDVACGYGRHATYFCKRNHPVALVDRAQDAIDSIAIESISTPDAHGFEKVVADIENGPWPFSRRQFDAVVVTNYLWRPLMPTLLASLAPGGVLIYETFSAGNETVGKPSRPDFLLRSAELLTICRGLRVIAFEEGFVPGAKPGSATSSASAGTARFIQRIAAVNDDSALPGFSTAERYPLA